MGNQGRESLTMELGWEEERGWKGSRGTCKTSRVEAVFTWSRTGSSSFHFIYEHDLKRERERERGTVQWAWTLPLLALNMVWCLELKFPSCGQEAIDTKEREPVPTAPISKLLYVRKINTICLSHFRSVFPLFATEHITIWQSCYETLMRKYFIALFSWTRKSPQMGTAAMKLKDACFLEEKLWQT